MEKVFRKYCKSIYSVKAHDSFDDRLLLIGGYSTMLIPREEEPQIQVPMADVFIGFPGAEPKEVETKLVQPMEKMISNIKGVEYVYSTSMKGRPCLSCSSMWEKM